MKKFILMLFCICLIGFSTDALAQVSKTESGKNNSISKTTTTQKTTENKTYTNPKADRQNKKGDTQLNKANSSYQKAQDIQRNNNSTSTSRPSNNNSAAKDNHPTSKPATNSATNNKTPNTNTKPTTTNNQTRKKPTATNNNSTSKDNNSTTKPTTTSTTTSKTPATSTTTTNKTPATTAAGTDKTPTDRTTETDNTAKRGYNDKGEAKPQLAPSARTNNADGKNSNGESIGDEKLGYHPYTHPNSHGFGNHYTHIPSHARPVYYNNRPYYFYNSHFCRYVDGRYIICRPPIGAVIAYNLFHTWRPIIIVYQNVNYYYDDGTFYKPYSGHNQHGYQVVEPPIGARIAELPSTYEYLNLDGRAYFKVDNVYFKEVIVGGYIWYEVVWVGRD